MAYRLNRKLVLEMPARVNDGAGGFLENWLPLGTVWAHVIARSGRETAAVGASVSRVAMKIIVRAAPPASDARPHPDQRFREGTRVYRILAVTEDDQDGRFLVCTAQEETIA